MKKKPVILIVDDVSANIKILSAFLSDDYEIKIAENGKEGMKLANEMPLPDIILLDVNMQEMSGYDVIKRLKENDLTEPIPVIFITANDTSQDEEDGLLLGAVDYITKPIRTAIVKARINTHLVLQAQKDALVYIAVHDQLTALFNRYYLNDVGTSRFSRAKRNSDDLSVVMIDIDYFKVVNDNHGHIVGDKILKAVAKLLNDNQRVEDFTVRYGGEEFLILLEGCNALNAKDKANTLRESLESLKPEGLDITASFGVAELSSKHGKLDELIRDADNALYKAKKAGRNRVKVYT